MVRKSWTQDAILLMHATDSRYSTSAHSSMSSITIHLDLQLISDTVNTPSLPTQGRFTHPRPLPHWAHQRDQNHKRLRPSQPEMAEKRNDKAGWLSVMTCISNKSASQQASATPSHPLRRSGGEGDPCQAPHLPQAHARQAWETKLCDACALCCV